VRSFRAWPEIHAPIDMSRSTPDAVDWRQFTAVKLQEDLKFRADASGPRGARAVTAHAAASSGPQRRDFQKASSSIIDTWLMASAVDHYATAISSPGGGDPIELMARLDVMRSAAHEKAWWVGALQAGADRSSAGSPTAADIRLRAWSAISRGAGTISFDNWRELAGDASASPSDTDRLRAAGDVAGIIGRNSSLFSPLRPHASRIAIVANPARPPLDVYKAFFDRNIQVDFVHPDEVAAGIAARYDVVDMGDMGGPSGSAAQFLKAFVRAGGTLIAETSGGSSPVPADKVGGQGLDEIFVTASSPQGARASGPDVVAGTYGGGRTVLIHRHPSARGTEARDTGAVGSSLERAIDAAGVKPEVGIDVPGQLVEARFLESADAMLLVAMNHGSTPRRVTFTFGPDVPEAIWQNMESGAAVNFVQGAEGPTYTRTLAGKDVMVLVRGKRLR
jgi:hypothetical protein